VDRSALATLGLGAFGAPDTMTNLGAGGGTVVPDLRVLCHSCLSLIDHDANVIPLLAERLPSIEDGTWVVNSDGTMRLTWHLRRNVKWHDGHPFTSKDVRFSWEFNNDPAIPPGSGSFTLLQNVTAIDPPDDYTAVMHWKRSNPFAQLAAENDLHIYPEHIIRPMWEAMDAQQLKAHPYLREGFVGLGPYRIESWTDDGTIIFRRFEDYFLGTPKIGTIVHHTAGSSAACLPCCSRGSSIAPLDSGCGSRKG